MPDWREPLPDLPLPPNGRCASAPEVELLIETMPGADALAEAEGVRRRGRVDRRREAVAVAVGQLHRLVEGRELRDADERAERLGRVDVVLRPSRRSRTSGGRRARPRGRRRSPSRGVVGRDPARRASSRGRVWWSRISPSHSSKRSAKRSCEHRPVEDVLRRVADRRALRSRSSSRRTNSSWIASWTIAVPSDVQRWPAVPKPREQRALDREVEVGVVHHDHRVLAAELEAGRLQVAPAERADLGADGAESR